MTINLFFNECGETLRPAGFEPDFMVSFTRPIPFDNAIISPEKVKFPKPLWLIESGPDKASLSLSAKRLLNLISCISWDLLRDKNADYSFGAYSSDMRRAIGQKTSSGNSQIYSAIKQLVKTPIIFPKLNNLVCPLLQEAHFEDKHTVLAWSFSPELRDVISRDHYWSMIHIEESLKLTSKYALSLYEFACAYYRRKHPVINATPEQLRLYLGAGDALPSWQAFKTKALLPAIKQLNEKTRFNVSMETEMNRRTQAVSKVKLKVTTKAALTKTK